MLRPRNANRRPWRRPIVVVPVVLAGIAGAAVPVTLSLSHAEVRIAGVADGALLDKAESTTLELRVTPKGSRVKDLRLELDGRRVQGAAEGGTLTYHPAALPDGRHVFAVSAPSRLGVGTATEKRTFTVDTTPPKVTVDDAPHAGSLRAPVTVTGSVEGADTLALEGKPVAVANGKFTLHFDAPPANAKLVAKDAAGNVTTDLVSVPVRHPMVRGVHVTGYAWNYTGLRNPVLQLARQHKINAVELDIKEEDGYVNYATSVPLAHKAGAIRKLYDPKKVIAQLHAMNIQVIGRIVAFRDPILATYAWRHGHRDWDVQTPAGQPYSSKYGAISFTNFASPAVRQYNIDLATEAAKLGFDDVMYDYVRRPDGPLPNMRFPGIKGTPEQGIEQFVRDTRGPVRAAGAYLGAAVFGVSATRPKEVAQNIPEFAKYVDYVAPMVYPSHWATGEYKVANPNAQPYAIVQRSLKDFQKKVAGTDAQVFPWLQDFSLGVTYDTPQVVAQIKAARDDGIQSFFLWDAGCSYHSAALTPIKQ